MNVKLKLKSNKSEDFLTEIAKEFKKIKIKINDLKTLSIIFPKDDSFTTIKMRETLLNTLRFALDISINGTKKITRPIYKKAPNITKKGKKS